MSGRGARCFGTDIGDFHSIAESGKIDFLQGDLLTLDLPENSFDIVTIWHVLEHTPRASAVLARIASLLKPGGVLAIAVPNFGSRQSEFFGPSWFHLDAPRHLFHFRRADVMGLLSQNGLEVVEETTQSLSQNLYGFLQSALNKILPMRPPNELYSLLKQSKSSPTRRLVGVAVYTPLAAPLFALGCLENFLSTMGNRGATLTVIARKN